MKFYIGDIFECTNVDYEYEVISINKDQIKLKAILKSDKVNYAITYYSYDIIIQNFVKFIKRGIKEKINILIKNG